MHLFGYTTTATTKVNEKKKQKQKLEKCQPKPETSTINEYVCATRTRKQCQNSWWRRQDTNGERRVGLGNLNRRLSHVPFERWSLPSQPSSPTPLLPPPPPPPQKSPTINVNNSGRLFVLIAWRASTKLNFTAAQERMNFSKILCGAVEQML